ncbi:MAG TPA: DNA polymerase III subunit epsilon [Stellaceae bacterium]|nr:DNA polymerase III subunit epsilon [Stellaceae bacterium]
MREIVLDTETTGLDPDEGHRIVEVACVELMNHLPTGRYFHRYVNPEREVAPEAVAIHGLSDAILAQHPPFAAMADEFLAFIADTPLVIHNAEFDLRFLNAELKRLARPAIAAAVVDTLALAKRRFPGSPASLDALCRRFAIDLSARDKHAARLDCELLAAVYLELVGGREPGLDLAAMDGPGTRRNAVARPPRVPRPHAAPADELAAHAAFVARLKNPLWRQEG